MDEIDSSNLESENDWKSAPPKEFLNIVLHELRTPMTLISGYVEILSNEKQKELHPEAIRVISDSIQKMEKLCEDIASYTRELMRKSDP